MSYNISPSLSDLFHSVWPSLGPSICCKWHYFILFNGWCSIVYMYHIFIHSPVDGHLDCFHVAIVNSTAMKIGMSVSFWMFFSGYMSRSGIAGSYGSSIFSFLRNPSILFPVAQMVKNLPAIQETQLQSLGQEDPLEKGMAVRSRIFLPGKSHGQRSLVGHSPWGQKESDATERLTLPYCSP